MKLSNTAKFLMIEAVAFYGGKYASIVEGVAHINYVEGNMTDSEIECFNEMAANCDDEDLTIEFNGEKFSF